MMVRDWNNYYRKKWREREQKYRDNDRKLEMISGYARAYLDILRDGELRKFKGTTIKNDDKKRMD
jgi:hypothetical protein